MNEEDKKPNNKVKKNISTFITITIIFFIIAGISVFVSIMLGLDYSAMNVLFVFEIIMGIIGSAVPVIAVIIIISTIMKVSSENKNNADSAQNSQQSDSNLQHSSKNVPKQIRCTYCKSLITDDETTCKYCGAKIK